MVNLRLLRAVFKDSGLGHATVLFCCAFVACAALLALFEPGIDGIGDALWCCFETVSTIGFGDVLVKTVLGRAVVVVLSIASIFFLAVLTAFVVNYCSEVMRAHRDQSIALFVDRLEHLPELDAAELEELSRQVRELRGRRA
ncbi:MAG: potassium channel family protein [Coriobacteriales bacterium]